MTAKKIHDWALKNGMRSAVVGIAGLTAVRDRLDRLRAEGALDAKFVQESLSGFRYLDGCRVERPRAVILLALPRPAHIVTFQFKDGDQEFILPPTYEEYRPTFDRICAQLRADFGASPSEVDLVSVPLKSLAAWAGLIRYGKNNLGYVPGWGSYIQLIALATGFPAARRGKLSDIESRDLERCGSCRACLNACPTGAITPARFMLHAERCYTLFSESPEPIPDTMPVPSPRCLMGCLKCQEVCPDNKGLLKYERTGVVFSRPETEAMLQDPLEKEERIWKDIRDKFVPLGVSDDVRLFARNLRVLTSRTGKEGDPELEAPSPGSPTHPPDREA
ncbi:MAG: 4Fe-4S binding protein [Candidatus Aminicenantes bacterium]|nr:4Fe-4S binding protein [Candidatus Aminicenantes bacterium]